MGARHVEGLDAAMPTEIVLRDTGIERIRFNILLTAKQSKIVLRYDQVHVPRHTTDAAVALICLDIGWRIDFEFYPATVAAALMCRHRSVLSFFFTHTTI